MAGKSGSSSRTFFSTLNETIFQCKRRLIDSITQGSLSLLHLNMFPTPALKWCPTSEEDLEVVETEILSVITKPFKSYFVEIGQGWGVDNNKIRTLEMLTKSEIEREKKLSNSTTSETNTNHSNNNTDIDDINEKKKQPLLLVHGFGCGIGAWILNIDSLVESLDRKIYAIDVIGFGRSTRAEFDLNDDVEGQFVESIERWREKQQIEKFIILGHSFGGYLSASYALRYPERIGHVILADPWGVQDRQNAPERYVYRFPIWVRVVNSLFRTFNPLAILRASGPYGPTIIQKFRSDLREKFRPVLHEDCDKYLTYLYHCNAQKATGESAFKALALPFGWPKNPLVHRLLDLNPSVSLSFIYGARSWIDKSPGEFLRDCMTSSRVSVDVLQGAGHHVYADKYDEFNQIVTDIVNRLP